MNLGQNFNDCMALQCETAMACINEARDPSTPAARLGELRGQLGHCGPCLSAFDVELRLRVSMTPSVSELPSIDFRMRITESLSRIDLGDLDITDF